MSFFQFQPFGCHRSRLEHVKMLSFFQQFLEVPLNQLVQFCIKIQLFQLPGKLLKISAISNYLSQDIRMDSRSEYDNFSRYITDPEHHGQHNALIETFFNSLNYRGAIGSCENDALKNRSKNKLTFSRRQIWY